MMITIVTITSIRITDAIIINHMLFIIIEYFYLLVCCCFFVLTNNFNHIIFSSWTYDEITRWIANDMILVKQTIDSLYIQWICLLWQLILVKNLWNIFETLRCRWSWFHWFCYLLVKGVRKLFICGPHVSYQARSIEIFQRYSNITSYS